MVPRGTSDDFTLCKVVSPNKGTLNARELGTNSLSQTRHCFLYFDISLIFKVF